jgi:tetratricopeptide (TPR) repeat protein
MDDNQYVYNNANVLSGLNIHSFSWALSTTMLGNWHPVTWWSHMLGIEIFGLWPGGHHLINIILHLLNSILVYFLSRKLGANEYTSLVISLIFSIHPSHIESVAWISERKDVLCAFFWLLGIHHHTNYRLARNSYGAYSSYIFFLLGLASKPMIVTYPLTILLVDYYLFRTGKIKNHSNLPKSASRILVAYSLPIIIISILTINAQTELGALAKSQAYTPAYDMVYNYLRYLIHFFYPVDLSILYVYEPTDFWYGLASLITLTLLTVITFNTRKSMPYVFFALCWYFITMFPISGIVPLGNHSIADRYLYMPSLGLIFGLTVLIRNQLNNYTIYKQLLSVAIVLSLALQAMNYTNSWNNSESIYLRSIENRGANPQLLYGMSQYLRDVARYDEAIHYINSYIALPNSVKTLGYNEKGVILYYAGKKHEAAEQWNHAVAINPDFEPALNNLKHASSKDIKPQSF